MRRKREAAVSPIATERQHSNTAVEERFCALKALALCAHKGYYVDS
jgi:hypothetical protein